MQNESSIKFSTLEVLGVGLSVESFDLQSVSRQINQNLDASILPADLPVQARQEREQIASSDKDFAGVLAVATGRFVKGWPIPAVSIWPTRVQSKTQKSSAALESDQAFFLNRLNNLSKLDGTCDKSFNLVGIVFADDPDDVLERAFQFFETNPTIPALLLFANDGMLPRKVTGSTNYVPYQRNRPRRVDSLVDAAGAILLARREAAEYMRQFLGTRATHIYAAGPSKPGFFPSRLMPQLWTHEQFDHFDKLLTLATLHRPIRLGFCTDKDGQVTFDAKSQTSSMGIKQRQEIFTSGFREALALANGRTPSRIFHDAGPYGQSQNGMLMGAAMFDCAPDFDADSPKYSFDIFSRIGNLGAVSPIAQWALALTASGANKDASMTFNLRQHDEATITVVTS